MKVIFTRQNDNGSYETVGMSNRMCQTLKSETMVDKIALNFSRGREVKVERYMEYDFYKPDAKPFYTTFVKGK